MKCFYCNAEVRWNNDFDTEDTYPDSEHNVVSMYNCDECDTWYEVFHQKKEEWKDELTERKMDNNKKR